MPSSNYDSDFCGGLPIHLTNLIQPNGILLVVEKEYHAIIQASDNTADAFKKPVEEVVGTSLIGHIGQSSYDALVEKLNRKVNDRIPAVWEIEGNQYVVL